jgi:hypothetical protein
MKEVINFSQLMMRRREDGASGWPDYEIWAMIMAP